MPMKNPPHPGQIVKHDVIEPLGLSVTAAAAVLGVSRKTLSELVNERAGISAEMAVRLEKAFGSTARLWLDLQTAYDLAQVKQDAIKVAKFTAPAPAQEPQHELL
jgi:addiction module HigA family antidote